jgi:hypothetical protein
MGPFKLRYFILLCGLFISIDRSYCIIGDDLPGLRKVYGAAKEEPNSYLFVKDGLSITVFFDGNNSAMEVFSRDPHFASQDPISREEIDKILDWEGKGHGWTESLLERSSLPVWIRSDQKVLARISYQEGQRVLVVMVNQR